MKKHIGKKLLIGNNEWCQLPKLHIPAIRAKIDTGAKTSAIHAFNIRTVNRQGKKYAYFDMHPLQANTAITVPCRALVVDEREIMSSNGHREHRYVIRTPLVLGDDSWEIEITLSNRDPLRYRMLLGREALNSRVLIDPSLSCRQGKLKKKDVLQFYKN